MITRKLTQFIVANTGSIPEALLRTIKNTTVGLWQHFIIQLTNGGSYSTGLCFCKSRSMDHGGSVV